MLKEFVDLKTNLTELVQGIPIMKTFSVFGGA
jgi:hypothetical protein